MLSRPLFGLALYMYFVESGREQRNLNRLLHATTWLALLVGFLSVTATQWNSKSEPFSPIIDALPTMQGFPGAEQGFNANEIAGAIAWLQPLMAGIALYRWRARQDYLGACVAFVFLTAGVVLGQSRLALIGISVAMGFLALTLVHSTPKRILALTVLAAAAGLEFTIFGDTQSTTGESGLSPRDEQSLAGRQGIWQSALNILHDYPLTGVGMSMFRDGRVRERYPAPGFVGDVLPHAHNEWLQVGADLGFPGLVVFVGWHVTAGLMLFYSWRRGDGQQKILAAGIAASLLAHGVFGLADAITLWDRFIFLYWWLLALVGAQFTVMKYAK
jgi:O-antigen ligase